MTSIFLRIYGGLLFTLVLVALLSSLAVTIINSVRIQEYRAEMARGTFRLVAMQLKNKPDSLQVLLLQQAEHLLGIPLELVKQPDTDAISKEDIRLLKSGDVKVIPLAEKQAHIYAWIQPGLLLRGTVSSISEQLAYGTLMLIKQHLISFPSAHREEQLQQLKDAFSYPLHMLKTSEIGLSPQHQQRLRDGHMVMILGPEGQSIKLYVGLEGGNLIGIDQGQKVLAVGPVWFLELYPLSLLVTIVLFVLTSVSLAIYILVRGLEQRLKKMEHAATSISRGNLDARVRVRGSDSVGRLAMAFNGMASHIQRLLSIQKEMIRGVSHELRTPVARLRFGLEMVADATSKEEQQKQLEGMDKDIQELDHLVDEILTYASLEQGAPVIHFKRVDIEEILSQVVNEQSHVNPSIAITLQPSYLSDQRRKADVERRYMHRAIQNLVANACRYANEKVQVTFSVGSDTCRIDVEDDGPGIPENEWDRVFTPFARLDDSRTRASGGYGLGLSIVRRIMYWHNGTAQVDHSSLGGAKFSLVWPRRKGS
ncbi:ATP-binding protein [Spartinivicinus ruber]|uniref:ATP-binding protein n=1 Tax=Spartinivicinus ruber TaxID=2683272 RepID=UPI0013D08227|nr:ATP-binding protein [Spartinivicinus ruber]